MPSSRGSSQPRDWAQVSHIADSWPTEPPGRPKKTGVGSLSLLQGIIPTQELNQGLLPFTQILYQLSYQGSPLNRFSSVQFNSVAQSCPTLCDPMNRSTPGLPVHHQLLEFTHTHVHQVSDAIQPSHPLSPPSTLALNLSQHQGLFHSFPMSWLFVHLVKGLELQLQQQSFQRIFRVVPLELTGLISLQSKGLSRVFSSTTASESISSLVLSLL